MLRLFTSLPKPSEALLFIQATAVLAPHELLDPMTTFDGAVLHIAGPSGRAIPVCEAFRTIVGPTPGPLLRLLGVSEVLTRNSLEGVLCETDIGITSLEQVQADVIADLVRRIGAVAPVLGYAGLEGPTVDVTDTIDELVLEAGFRW